MKVFIASASAFFLLFAVSRAIRVPLTYDEAASYIRYIDSSAPSVFDTNLLSIFNFEVATNHFLNTALTKLCYFAGGRSEFVLRLPNLCGYILYLGFAALILKRLSNPFMAIGGFLLLNLNPYLLDFFALSRGYGLSLGLLMGALFFLLGVVESPIKTRHPRDLTYALVFANAAVMANFALLNVYLSVVVIVTIVLVMIDRAAPHARTDSALDDRRPAGRSYAVWFVAAAIFTPLVFSQDARLSAALYEPVVVRLSGLDDAALDRTRVVRRDIHGRESGLVREPGSNEWTLRGRGHFRGLRIELPRGEAESLSGVEVVIGARPFSSNRQRSESWTAYDAGEMRVFESTAALSVERSRVGAFRSVINWAGDRVYARRLVVATVVALAILVACAVLLHLLGEVVTRAGLLHRWHWGVVSLSLLWVAALAGGPLYLLRRNSELYFGGTRGLVADTFTSIIESSFYGAVYSGRQVTLVLGLVVAVIALFGCVCAWAYRSRSASTVAPALWLVGILLVTSGSLIAQRFAFQTVYLVGRTALFYIPLFVLVFTCVCDACAKTGRFGRVSAVALMSVMVMLAGLHLARTANMKFVFDWKDDASTKRMIEDVQQFVPAGSSSRIPAGVAPAYAPVAVYYARLTAAPIEVVVVPTSQEISFLYDMERNLPSGDIVSRYPLPHASLVRVRR